MCQQSFDRDVATESSEIHDHPEQRCNRIMIIAPFGDNGITEVFINDRDPRLVGRWEMWSVQFDGKPYPTKGGDPRQMRWTRIDCNTFQHETLRQLYYNLPDGT